VTSHPTCDRRIYAGQTCDITGSLTPRPGGVTTVIPLKGGITGHTSTPGTDHNLTQGGAMTDQDTRIRSMKARRSSTCQCGRLILVGARITRHGGRWLCTDCAIAIATGKPAPQTRNAP
jgi:hypothetical protein